MEVHFKAAFGLKGSLNVRFQFRLDWIIFAIKRLFLSIKAILALLSTQIWHKLKILQKVSSKNYFFLFISFFNFKITRYCQTLTNIHNSYRAFQVCRPLWPISLIFAWPCLNSGLRQDNIQLNTLSMSQKNIKSRVDVWKYRLSKASPVPSKTQLRLPKLKTLSLHPKTEQQVKPTWAFNAKKRTLNRRIGKQLKSLYQLQDCFNEQQADRWKQLQQYINQQTLL